MRTLVLVAASGLAREVLEIERRVGRYDRYVVVDDDVRLWGTIVSGARVVGGLDALDALVELRESDVVVCAGRGSSRRSLVERLSAAGVTADRYARIVHPTAALPAGCLVCPGSILMAHVTLTADVSVGSHVVLMPQVTLTHDDVVSDYATLCAGVSLGGHVSVGEAAYVGMNACVREHVSIGAGATLGMGAVLLEQLPADETWVGTPARPLPVSVPLGA